MRSRSWIGTAALLLLLGGCPTGVVDDDADDDDGGDDDGGDDDAADDDAADDDADDDDGADDDTAGDDDSQPAYAITGISFDFGTVRTEAPGSDNWAITWADDGHQYTSWGDGGGFGGSNEDGRVSLGFGRVEGDKNAYQGHNVWGGKDPENNAQFEGKCYGIIGIDGTMYMWRSGDASGDTSFDLQELYRSTNHAASWEFTSVSFYPGDFPNSSGFFAPTFLQFGQDYAGARDSYVYVYAPEVKGGGWDVQYPGEITLMRVPKQDIEDRGSYEFFAGLDGNDDPTWTGDVAGRFPVWSDNSNGVMRIAVNYNAGIGRYLLVAQQVDRHQEDNGHIGIYDAAEPWGPWSTVLFDNAWSIGLQDGEKTVYWNFSNKWTSPDGLDFVLVYTGPGADNWGTVEGYFTVELVE